MSDIGADVFAELGVVSEYVVPLSVFSFVSCGWFVEWSVLVSAFVECFLIWRDSLVEGCFVGWKR